MRFNLTVSDPDLDAPAFDDVINCVGAEIRALEIRLHRISGRCLANAELLNPLTRAWGPRG